MKWPNIDQEELLQSHELLDPTELLHSNNPNELIIQDLSNKNLTLNVRDVNQANWNEVYCGLCMFVKGMQSSVNFTGDIRLIQAKNIYDQELQQNIATDNHILIAPHHGGENAPKHRVYSTPTTDVIISVGANNNYGHPSKHMLSYLSMLRNNNIYRTDVDGDKL